MTNKSFELGTYYKLDTGDIIKLSLNEYENHYAFDDMSIDEYMKYNIPHGVEVGFYNGFPNYSFFGDKRVAYSNKKIEKEYGLDFTKAFDHYKQLEDENKGYLFKIYVYDHSGCVLTLSRDDWDTTPVGFIFIKDAKNKAEAMRYATQEVDKYDKDFVNGSNIVELQVFNEQGEVSYACDYFVNDPYNPEELDKIVHDSFDFKDFVKLYTKTRLEFVESNDEYEEVE